jgi:DNA repair protein RecO (recombination protein O)
MARPHVYRVEGFVIRRMDYGEADRILTLYTRQEGRVRAIAKGVRRPTSRLAGHLELFVHADLLLARGRELDIVTQVETIESFRRVREELERSSYAYYLAELTDALTEERLENPAAFTALLEALQGLESADEPRLIVLYFVLQLLGAVGYRPELNRCLRCRAEIRPERNYFSVEQGGLLCPACGAPEPSARPIELLTLKALRHLQRTAAPAAYQVRAPEQVLRNAERLLREYAEHVLDRRLRVPEFIARVQAAGPRPALTP